MTRLRAGIVGYGYMGEIRRRNIENNADLELTGICDPGLTESPAFSAPLFSSDAALIDAVDVVFVCTPHFLSPDVAVRALRAGRHVFCEKPPGRNAHDVRRIMEAEAAAPDCRLMFGFNHRHHPGIADARAIVDSGSLGRILTLRGMYGKSGGEGFERSWRNAPESGGGILLDQGIHMLDLFRFFCGDFCDVVGMVERCYWQIPGEDNAFVLLRTPAGQIAQLHSSATSWKHTFRLEIGLERGYLAVSGLLSKTGSYGRETLLVGRRPRQGEAIAVGNPREEMTYYDTDPSWDLQVQEFARCIREGRRVPDSSSLDALRVIEIVDRVYAQQGQAMKAGGGQS